jgi:hypothetical protein
MQGRAETVCDVGAGVEEEKEAKGQTRASPFCPFR